MTTAAADRFAQMVAVLCGKPVSTSALAYRRVAASAIDVKSDSDDDPGLLDYKHADVWRALMRSIEPAAYR